MKTVLNDTQLKQLRAMWLLHSLTEKKIYSWRTWLRLNAKIYETKSFQYGQD